MSTESFPGTAGGPLFADRRAAGRALARLLEHRRGGDSVVVGLARGGVLVAAELARRLELELDALAVRKVRHPLQPELAVGAVAPGGGVYLSGVAQLDDAELAAAVAKAEREAVELDRALHDGHAARPLRGRPCILVDDGLATGATMVAAVRWARSERAAHVTAAVPVASRTASALLRGEADELVCPNEPDWFFAVGAHYARFDQVTDAEVLALLDAAERDRAARDERRGDTGRCRWDDEHETLVHPGVLSAPPPEEERIERLPHVQPKGGR